MIHRVIFYACGPIAHAWQICVTLNTPLLQIQIMRGIRIQDIHITFGSRLLEWMTARTNRNK
jgi:hypothetical protein